jgi:hypothetical protein
VSNRTEFLGNGDNGEPTSFIVRRLVDILGARLCAVIGGVKQTSAVREWIDGKEPTIATVRTLRFALRVAESIERRYGSAIAQSWFQGANRTLGDESPALLIKSTSRETERERFRVEEYISLALRDFLDR